MTDSSHRDLDQLASDLVDGLLPPDEAAHARREPEVAARAARIEQLRSALRSVPPPSPDHVSRAVSAAVAAASVAQPPQARRRPLAERARPWLVAAAVIALGGLATAGLLSADSNDSDDAATMSSEAGDSTESQEDTDAGAYDEGPGDGGSDAPASPPVASDLGDAANPGELAALVEEQAGDLSLPSDDEGRILEEGAVELPESTTMPDPTAADTCPGLGEAGDPARGTTLYTADATYQGAPVRVHVYERDGGTRLVATNHSCSVVVDEPFNP